MEQCVEEEAIVQVKSVDEVLPERMEEAHLTRRFLKLETPFSVDVRLFPGLWGLKEADQGQTEYSSLDSKGILVLFDVDSQHCATD